MPVDLEQLASLMESDPVWGGGRIDLKTGDCWPQSSGYEAYEGYEDDSLDEDGGRWLDVECIGSGAGYRDMELFIATVDDPAIADRLQIAISGKGAFRRFKDVLSRWPDELHRYFLFCSERQVGRARAWLAVAGYTPVTPARCSNRSV
ncbi:UPF0158 family protein [Mycobacterium haemophilum]